MKVKLVSCSQPEEGYSNLFQTITNTARTSYAGISKGYEKDLKLLKYLWEHQHGEPFEFIDFTFYVECPIFVTRQWFRHRLFSKNEISARYKELERKFYIPKVWRKQSKNNKQGSDGTFQNDILLEQYINSCNESFDVYEELVESGVSKELARIVLPVSTYTQFRIKGNLRVWMHFISLRTDSHAQEEIRILAKDVEKIIFEIIPEMKDVIYGN